MSTTTETHQPCAACGNDGSEGALYLNGRHHWHCADYQACEQRAEVPSSVRVAAAPTEEYSGERGETLRLTTPPDLTLAEWRRDLELRERLIAQQFGDGGHLPSAEEPATSPEPDWLSEMRLDVKTSRCHPRYVRLLAAHDALQRENDRLRRQGAVEREETERAREALRGVTDRQQAARWKRERDDARAGWKLEEIARSSALEEWGRALARVAELEAAAGQDGAVSHVAPDPGSLTTPDASQAVPSTCWACGAEANVEGGLQPSERDTGWVCCWYRECKERQVSAMLSGRFHRDRRLRGRHSREVRDRRAAELASESAEPRCSFCGADSALAGRLLTRHGKADVLFCVRAEECRGRQQGGGSAPQVRHEELAAPTRTTDPAATALFQTGAVQLHSGDWSAWKICCEALTDADLATLAQVIVAKVGLFCEVVGIPTGGVRLASILRQFSTPGTGPILIVDDVLTTGGSMEAERKRLGYLTDVPIAGVVLFARQPPPPWVQAVFSLWADPLLPAAPAPAEAPGADPRLTAGEPDWLAEVRGQVERGGCSVALEWLLAERDRLHGFLLVRVDELATVAAERNELRAEVRYLKDAPVPAEAPEASERRCSFCGADAETAGRLLTRHGKADVLFCVRWEECRGRQLAHGSALQARHEGLAAPGVPEDLLTDLREYLRLDEEERATRFRADHVGQEHVDALRRKRALGLRLGEIAGRGEVEA